MKNQKRIKNIYLTLYILFIIATIVLVGTILLGKQINFIIAVICAVFGMIFGALYRNISKAIEENDKYSKRN